MPVRARRNIAAVRLLLLVCLAAVLPACDEAASQEEESERSAVGFEAVITGAYEGRVSGPGVLKLLPEAGFDRQGYFFLADDQGLRPHGVTFVLPRGTGPGKHTLESPSALDIGTVPSVRVDRDLGQAAVSAEKNTSGFLELTAFPAEETGLTGSEVAGRFEFETENSEGERIRV
ncbi:MAG TPA: hypothetical protein VLL72_10725, partial [Kiloniellales bacterium]|nr:hypothetical protein [Kiloniellales bacterium]